MYTPRSRTVLIRCAPFAFAFAFAFACEHTEQADARGAIADVADDPSDDAAPSEGDERPTIRRPLEAAAPSDVTTGDDAALLDATSSDETAVLDATSSGETEVIDATSTGAPPLADSAPPAPDASAPVAPPDAATEAAAPADAPLPAPIGLGAILDEATFEEMFPHRGESPCEGSFYTYTALLEAARDFPEFAAEGTADARRREVAAFLANAGHETTRGWTGAVDGRAFWGLCWVLEGSGAPESTLPDYCVFDPRWPCAPITKYYGRGPLQLSYNYNYGRAGDALGVDLLSWPELVSTDPTLTWKAALWFWTAPQPPMPSCHDVMNGGWSPTTADVAAGRRAGFGLTIDVINGRSECGKPTGLRVQDRVAFYARFSDLLGVDTGAELTCENMLPW
jgi:chitinase